MSDEPASLSQHAVDDLRFIREAMERASSFTSIPGWGGMLIGVTAVAASVVASDRLPSTRPWLTVWLLEAAVAALIGAATMALKAGRTQSPFMSGAARRFFISYGAPMFAGAALSFALLRRGQFETLPAVWLILYGCAFVSSGAFSLRVIPIMGVAFMILGVCAVPLDLPAGNVVLGAGFGGLHLIFGFIIGRNHGG